MINNEKSLQQDKVLVAIFYVLLAHFMFSMMSASAKYLSGTHHVVELLFYRSIITFVPILFFIIIRKKMHLLHTKKPVLVAMRAIIGAFSMLVTYSALSRLPMAYSTVIFSTSTIITPVLAFLFLKEHVGIHRWSAVIIGMCGVLIISQPSGAVSMSGLIFALAAASMHASVYTLLRGLKSENPFTVTFYFIAAGTVISLIFMPWVAKPLSLNELWIFVFLSVSGAIAQFCLSCAYKYAPASLVSPFGFSALIWTILMDVFFWKYNLDFVSIFVGSGIILCAQLYIIHREYVNSTILHSKNKQAPKADRAEDINLPEHSEAER